MKEVYKLVIAITAITAVAILRGLDKIDTSLLSAVVFTVLGYYFGKHENTIIRKLRGKE